MARITRLIQISERAKMNLPATGFKVAKFLLSHIEEVEPGSVGEVVEAHGKNEGLTVLFNGKTGKIRLTASIKDFEIIA